MNFHKAIPFFFREILLVHKSVTNNRTVRTVWYPVSLTRFILSGGHLDGRLVAGYLTRTEALFKPPLLLSGVVQVSICYIQSYCIITFHPHYYHLLTRGY